jgi:hypothetical protein
MNTMIGRDGKRQRKTMNVTDPSGPGKFRVLLGIVPPMSPGMESLQVSIGRKMVGLGNRQYFRVCMPHERTFDFILARSALLQH